MIILWQSSHRKDLTGEVFGELTVKEYFTTLPKGIAVWKCECSCGNIVQVQAHNLLRGHTKSCGCLRLAKLHDRAKHGQCGKHPTRLWRCWEGMKQRALNPSNPRHKYYFDKGIRICAEWRDFANFATWAKSHGYNESLVLDRIDSDKDYCPNNCRWITKEENSRNATIERSRRRAIANPIDDIIAGG